MPFPLLSSLLLSCFITERTAPACHRTTRTCHRTASACHRPARAHHITAHARHRTARTCYNIACVQHKTALTLKLTTSSRSVLSLPNFLRPSSAMACTHTQRHETQREAYNTHSHNEKGPSSAMACTHTHRHETQREAYSTHSHTIKRVPPLQWPASTHRSTQYVHNRHTQVLSHIIANTKEKKALHNLAYRLLEMVMEVRSIDKTSHKNPRNIYTLAIIVYTYTKNFRKVFIRLTCFLESTASIGQQWDAPAQASSVQPDMTILPYSKLQSPFQVSSNAINTHHASCSGQACNPLVPVNYTFPVTEDHDGHFLLLTQKTLYTSSSPNVCL